MKNIVPAITCALSFLAAHAFAEELSYPMTRRVDVVDTYHGQEVPDPYRWLEQDVRESEEVAKWVEAENEVTRKYLDAIPSRDGIEKRLTELWNYEKFSSPFKRGGRYYFYKNDGLQNQSVLYTQKTLEHPPSVLIDPNTWSEDGTVALAGTSFSDDGKYVAYGVAEAGSDWKHIRVMEVATGTILEDRIEWTKSGGVDWLKDGSGFFYSRFPAPQDGKTFQSVNLNSRLCFHRLGTPQDQDILIHEDPKNPDWNFYGEVSEDGHYLIVYVSKGTDRRNQLWYAKLDDEHIELKPLIDHFDNEYSFIGNDGHVFYFRTDLDAPRRRIVAIDIRDPAEVRQIIPEAAETMRGVGMVHDWFVVSYLKDAVTQVKMYTTRGALVREVQFPGLGDASGFGGKRDHDETFYTFDSFNVPPSIYRYDMKSGRSELLRRSEVAFDGSNYEVKQVFYQSKDGTKVPMFITHRKGITLDGSHPTLLYGYGGFNIPLTPGFSITRAQWLEMGGVYAVANIRGGGEYGEKWHQQGTKLEKQNTFDDFVTASEWLIANKYTNQEKLAIQGGSNGGLLVGACMTQRPELFAVALPAVGVMDMLRFHKFTAGRYWVDDYGSSDNAEEFNVLLGYSPYHNLKEGVDYPATLVTTADTDDRVVPMHSFKFAAALQHAHKGDNPVLIRIETRAGHGAGVPTSKRIAAAADVMAFLVENLGMGVEPQSP